MKAVGQINPTKIPKTYEMSLTPRPNLLPYLGTFVVSSVLGASYLAFKSPALQEDVPTTKVAAPTSSIASASSPAGNLTDRIVDSFGEESASVDFVTLVENLPISELYQVSEGWAIFYDAAPEEAEAWLKSLSDQLVQRDAHERALELMAYLSTQAPVPQIERTVLHDWLSTNEEDLRAHVHAKALEGGVNEHHASILASIFLNEGGHQLESWQEWIGEQSGPRGLELQGLMIGKFAHHASKDQLQSVAALMERHLDNQIVMAHMPQLAVRLSEDNPRAGLEWVAALELGDEFMRAETMGHLLYNVAQSDPDLAWSILEADDFLARYHEDSAGDGAPQGGWSHTAQEFFDKTLESYIHGLVLVDPQAAIASAGAFFSEEKGASMKQEIETYLRDHASMAAGGAEGHDPDCAGCSHSSHQ